VDRLTQGSPWQRRLALLLLRLVDGLGLVGRGYTCLPTQEALLEPKSVLLLGLVLVARRILLILGLRTSLAGSAAAICTGRSGPVRQPSLRMLGSAMERVILFALVFFLSSSLALLVRRLFAGCAAHRLASNQAVIWATVLQRTQIDMNAGRPSPSCAKGSAVSGADQTLAPPSNRS